MGGLRLLIAHSDESLLDTCQGFFGDHGFETEVATNALECLTTLHEFQPDVLLLHRELLWGGGDGVIAHLRDETVQTVPAAVLLLVDDRLEPVAPLVVPPVHAAVRLPVDPSTMLDAVLSTLLEVVLRPASIPAAAQTQCKETLYA